MAEAQGRKGRAEVAAWTVAVRVSALNCHATRLPRTGHGSGIQA